MENGEATLWKLRLPVVLCLVSSCFHALCYAYIYVTAGYRLVRFFMEYPIQEFIVMLFSVTLLFKGHWASCLKKFDFLTSRMVDHHYLLAFLADLKPDFEDTLVGTDIHRAAAWDMTKFSVMCCASGYAIAFFLQFYFNVFRLFLSLMVVYVFSAYMTFFFAQSCLMNLKILRHYTSNSITSDNDNDVKRKID